MTVGLTMETDHLNKKSSISESGISTSITYITLVHSKSSLKINESVLLNNKMKMLQAQEKKYYCAEMFNALNLIRGRAFESIIPFEIVK